jgi:hypothetical protein
MSNRREIRADGFATDRGDNIGSKSMIWRIFHCNSVIPLLAPSLLKDRMIRLIGCLDSMSAFDERRKLNGAMVPVSGL